MPARTPPITAAIGVIEDFAARDPEATITSPLSVGPS
jgi:hypothetical protein